MKMSVVGVPLYGYPWNWAGTKPATASIFIRTLSILFLFERFQGGLVSVLVRIEFGEGGI